jgi:hypothetical protein
LSADKSKVKAIIANAGAANWLLSFFKRIVFALP